MNKPIEIEVSQQGKFFALSAEKQLVAVITDREGAEIVEAMLRGMVYYSSRNAFRIALKDALDPETRAAKLKKSEAKEAASAKANGKKKGSKKSKAKVESVPEVNHTPVGTTEANAQPEQPATEPIAPATEPPAPPRSKKPKVNKHRAQAQLDAKRAEQPTSV